MKALIFLIATAMYTQTMLANEAKFKTLADLDTCEKMNSYDTSVCLEPLKKFINENPSRTLEAARKGRRVFKSWVVLPFFDQALTKSKDLSICQDPDFQTSLFSALAQPPTNDTFKIAKKLTEGDCASKITEPLLKEVNGSTPDSYLSEVACPILKKAGKKSVNCEPKPKAAEVQASSETLPMVEKKSLKIGETKIYVGPEGSKVTIGSVKDQENAFLIKFDGFKSAWNNKALLHKAKPAGRNGEMDYWTEYEGSKWVSVTLRSCYSGSCKTEVHVPGGPRDGVAVFYDENKSKNEKPDLVQSFQ